MREIQSQKISVIINWSTVWDTVPEIYDCDFDPVMAGFDIFAVLLDEFGHIVSENDLLYYNSNNRNLNGQITSSDNSVTYLSASNENNIDFGSPMDDYDEYEIDFNLVNSNVKEIRFLIGRPASKEMEHTNNWIDDSQIRKNISRWWRRNSVTSKLFQETRNKFSEVFYFIENIRKPFKFFYNQWGVICFLSIQRHNGKWHINEKIENGNYRNGLLEIIERHIPNNLKA